MRRTVWRVIPGTKHKFGSTEKQSRYDTMRLMEKVYSEMTERELETIVKRIQSKKQEAENPSQTALFSILIFCFLFLSSGINAQTIKFEYKDSTTLGFIIIDEHLEFYNEKEDLELLILYKENRQDRFYSDDRDYQVTGILQYEVKKSGFYKFQFHTDSYPCEFIIERCFKINEDGSKLTGGANGFLKCIEPNFPNKNKPSAKM